MHSVLSKKNKTFQAVLVFVMLLIMLITIYPVWYTVINSLNDPGDLAQNGYVMLLPREFTLASWKTVLADTQIMRALLVTICRTVLVTIFQTLITSMFAYGFSRPNLTGRKLYSALGFICMYLNGGTVAYFILFNTLHLYDTFWVYVFPCLFGGFYNVIIYNANFKTLPESLYESAKIDGANEMTIFFRIVFPLSKPVISALGIFTAVGMWNNYTQTLYFTRDKNLWTLAYYTLALTKSTESAAAMASSAAGVSVVGMLSNSTDAVMQFKTIEMSCMILSALPLIIAYPFAQKFFEKGVMVGSVKG